MSLSQKVKQLSRTPGVYLFKNARGKVIYVGKAIRLRDRVASYFQKPIRGGGLEGGLKAMLPGDIVDIEVRQTDSEIEALVLEAFLIKTLKPRYNVAMKDDKQYFYVAFTKEIFPKIVVLHQPQATSHSLQPRPLGPFVSGRALKATLRALRKIFPYCACKTLHARKKSCISYHIGIDPGYCCSKEPSGRAERTEYARNVSRVKDILQGKKARVIATLKEDMEKAALSRQFERAARLRNQLNGIEYILAHRRVLNEWGQKVFPAIGQTQPSILQGITAIEGYDISNIQGQFAVGSLVVIARDEQGIFTLQKNAYRRFNIRTVKGANDPAMMREVIRRRLRHLEWPLPDVMLIDGGVPQRNAALGALEAFTGKRKPLIWSLAKQLEELYTSQGKMLLESLSSHDARVLTLARDEAHRFAISYYRKRHTRALLGNENR